MLYTTYFAKLRSLPDDVIPVSICGKAPEWFHGVQYKKLAPQWGFFQEWKKSKDNHYYVKCFEKLVLSTLNPKDVMDELYSLTHSANIALVCYEKPEGFCHRHLVANWFREHGYEIKEFGS